MFHFDHKIWQFCYQSGELDDWLPFAKELVNKWRDQSASEIKFESTFEIGLASLLLMDDLLPHSARIAFANKMLEAMAEVEDKKMCINSLMIKPPKAGRKENRTEFYWRMHAVREHIKKGASKSEAYKLVAKEYHKSVDTIRRDFERIEKQSKQRRTPGKSPNDFPGDVSQ